MAAALTTSGHMTPMQLKSLPRTKKLEALRELRIKPTRNPTAVVLLAADVLASGTGPLGDEAFTVLEQYVIASLELGNRDHAAKALLQLVKQFGQTSIRIRKLYGLLAESAGENDKARDIYRSILQDSASDAFAAKRFSAMAKAEGRYQDAIDALESHPIYTDEDKNSHRFLAVHNADEAAYRELLNLHYMLGKWDRCVFYAEESILINPYSYLNHVRHAEVCYAAKHYERSASAYAHALTLNESSNNSRAAYGLLMVAKELSLHKKPSRSGGEGHGGVAVAVEDVKALKVWASQRLKALYQGTCMAGALDVMLQGDQ